MFSIVLVAGLVVLTGCGRKEKKEQIAEEERLKQLGNKAEVLVDSSKLSDADRLVSFLPKVMPDMKRTGKPEAKKIGSIGKRVSRAEVMFEGETGVFVEFSITDAVNLKGMAAVKDAEWTTKEVKEDTDARFVGIGKKDGRRLYKEFNFSPKKAIARVLVADRFIVEVVTSEMEYPATEALLDQIQIAALEKMAAKK